MKGVAGVAFARDNRGNNQRRKGQRGLRPTPGGEFFQKSLSTNRCLSPLELNGKILKQPAMFLQNADVPQSHLASDFKTVGSILNFLTATSSPALHFEKFGR